MNPRLLSVPYPENYERLSPELKKPYKEKQKLLDLLIEFYDKYKNTLVVADYFNLGREGKVFSIEMKKVIRPNVLVECEHFVMTNWHWDSAGKVYVFKEAETEARTIAHENWKLEMKKKEELKEEVGEAFKDAMDQIGKNAKKKVEVKANEKVMSRASLKKQFLKNCNQISKEDLTKIAEENSLPEEEYSAFNTEELKEFLAEALCEIPGVLKNFVK